MHSTNYCNTLILVSEDCKATTGTIPPRPGTVAAMQYQMISAAPYAMTSDDLLVTITGQRREVPEEEIDALREEIFSKGQPCMRTSPLVRTYGWGVHHDAQGRVALVAKDCAEYDRLADDPGVTKVRGMKSRR